MPGQTPQVLARRGTHGRPRSANKPARTEGSENVSNKVARDKGPNDKGSEATAKSETAKPARTKHQDEGEKLVIRRLPPGMTEAEFTTILGPEWELSKGKVDWFSYAQGKVSKDPSKPSRPSRAYIHVMRKDDIMPLSEAVRSKTWEDAKGTFTSPSLIAPPAVEFCIHKKIPSNKRRTDTRQGTIDQDPEFMAFLESLANPTQPKDIEAEDEDADKPEPKVSTTPLIEYLKEKKANKGKDGSKKNSRNADGKGKGGSKDDETSKKKGKGFKEDKSDKPKETIKILTKKAATEQAAEAAKNAAGQINASNCSSTADAPKSRRANIAAAARILQRDLGLSPGSAHRRARQDAAKADAEAKTDAKPPAGKDAGPTAGPSTTGTERPASPAPSDAGSQTSKAKSQSGRRNRGGKNADKGKNSETPSTQAPTAFNPPVILKKKPEGEDSQPAAAAAPEPTSSEQANTSDAPQSTTNKSSSGKSQGQKKPASISPDATRAFVKHANASQGVTDAALREALERFGSVTGVEVDKRKGFAYVDFADHEGLVKAISGSPVTVGQGSVQVLERKEKKPANQGAGGASSGGPTAEKSERNSGRGRRGRGGGGGKNAANDKNQSATPAEGGGG